MSRSIISFSTLLVICNKCLKINKDYYYYYYYYYVLSVSTLFLCKKAENKYGGDPSTRQTHFDYTTPRFRYILCTLYTYTYILVYAEFFLRHDKLKRLKCFQSWSISLFDISWKHAIIKNYFKTLFYLSNCGIWDGRVWVSYSWYHCCFENLFQKS